MIHTFQKVDQTVWLRYEYTLWNSWAIQQYSLEHPGIHSHLCALMVGNTAVWFLFINLYTNICGLTDVMITIQVQGFDGRLFQFWMLEKFIPFNKIETLVKSMDWWIEQWKISRRSLAGFFKHGPVPDSGRVPLVQWNHIVIVSFSIVISSVLYQAFFRVKDTFI